jgi:hypothetical protein
MPEPAHEVRRCALCREPAVVMVSLSKDESTQLVTRDYSCQVCGHEFTLHPRMYGWMLIGFGLLMGCAILPLGLCVLGVHQLRTDPKNPVVPGAALPEVTRNGGPRARRCPGCGAPVVTAVVSRGRWQSLTTHYVCSCGTAFIIENAHGAAYALCMAVICGLACGALYDGLHVPVLRFGGAALMATFGVALCARIILRAANRWRCPTV